MTKQQSIDLFAFYSFLKEFAQDEDFRLAMFLDDPIEHPISPERLSALLSMRELFKKAAGEFQSWQDSLRIGEFRYNQIIPMKGGDEK